MEIKGNDIKINEKIIRISEIIAVSSSASFDDALSIDNEKHDFVALTRHMVVSFDPFYYAVSIRKNSFLSELIEKSNCFVVNFLSEDTAEKVISGMRIDAKYSEKFSLAGLSAEPAQKLECVRIKEAVAYLECTLAYKVDVGKNWLFLGQVLFKEIKYDEKRPVLLKDKMIFL